MYSSVSSQVKFNTDKNFLGNKIDFVCTNFLTLCPVLKPDLIFLSPPWGGPDYYIENESFKLENMYIGGLNGIELLEKELEITPNVKYFLPKNTDLGLIQSRVQIPWEVMTKMLSLIFFLLIHLSRLTLIV